MHMDLSVFVFWRFFYNFTLDFYMGVQLVVKKDI